MMVDREKVIKGLECCMTMPDIYPRCEECPYAGADGTCGNLNGLHRDALSLLKAQEARIVTEADFKNADINAIPVEWLEDRIYDMKRAPLYRRYAEMLLMEWLQEQKEQEVQDD